MKTKFEPKREELRTESRARNILAACLLALTPLTSSAITPFYIKLVNATNAASAQTIGVALLTPPTQIDTPFTINGTNFVFGGNSATNFTIVLDSTGYSSNAFYAGTYKFVLTNFNAAFIAVIPDTTNLQSLTLYTTNIQVFSGVALSSYGNLTNLLGFAPATNTPPGITNALGFIPANAANTNDFARASGLTALSAALTAVTASLGTISTRGSNDFALATPAGITNSLAYIPANAANTNDFARATTPGITNALGFIPANAANTNDFARANFAAIIAALGYTPHTNDGYIGWTNLPAANIATNGFISWVTYKTNGPPGSAFTNLPQGSLMSTTNGQFYVLSNLVWTLK